MVNKIVKFKRRKKELILEDNRMIDLEIDVYTKRQHRILNYIKRKVNTAEYFQNQIEEYIIPINLKELYEYIGFRSKSKKEIEKDFKFLRDHSIRFINKSIGMSWIATYNFEKLVGHVIIEITPSMKEYIYPKEYTKYLPETAKNFSCNYSYGIYPILKKCHEINKQYHKNTPIILDLNTLYDKFELGEQYRNNFGLFKLRILTPVLKDLKGTDLNIEECIPIKDSHKTTKLELTISAS